MICKHEDTLETNNTPSKQLVVIPLKKIKVYKRLTTTDLAKMKYNKIIKQLILKISFFSYFFSLKRLSNQGIVLIVRSA